MKKLVNPLKLVISAIVCYSALFSLVNAQIYEVLVEIVNSLPRQIGVNLPIGNSLTLILLGLTTLLVFLVSFSTDEDNIKLLTTISILFYVPAVVQASNANWISIIGIKFENYLSFNTIFAIGIIIVVGHLLLYNLIQTENISSNLLDRGASRNEVNQVVKLKIKYFSSITLISGALAYSIIPIYSILGSKLEMILLELPFIHILIVASTASVVALTAFFYLRSEEKEEKTRS